MLSRSLRAISIHAVLKAWMRAVIERRSRNAWLTGPKLRQNNSAKPAGMTTLQIRLLKVEITFVITASHSDCGSSPGWMLGSVSRLGVRGCVLDHSVNDQLIWVCQCDLVSVDALGQPRPIRCSTPPQLNSGGASIWELRTSRSKFEPVPRPRSSMERTSAFEAEGCRFEPCRGRHRSLMMSLPLTSAGVTTLTAPPQVMRAVYVSDVDSTRWIDEHPSYKGQEA